MPSLGKKGTLNDGLRVAFTTGAVMGFAVVGMGLAGVSLCYLVLANVFGFEDAQGKTMQCLVRCTKLACGKISSCVAT